MQALSPNWVCNTQQLSSMITFLCHPKSPFPRVQALSSNISDMGTLHVVIPSQIDTPQFNIFCVASRKETPKLSTKTLPSIYSVDFPSLLLL